MLRLAESVASTSVDRVVRDLAASITQHLGPDDVLARGGFGELLALIRTTGGDAAAGERFAHRVVERVARDVEDGRLGIDPGLGAGVCHVTGAVADAVRGATVAARWAHRAPTRVETFARSRHVAEDRARATRHDIRGAIAAGALDVHLQPIVDTATGAVVAAEGLLRWDRRHTLLATMPAVLDALVDDPLQLALDRYVVELGCRHTAAMQRALGDRCPRVALNVSPRSLADPSFAGFVGDAIDAAGLEPSLLGLELTEHEDLPPDPALYERVLALRARGVTLAIDDFGAGHSSLQRLLRLDVDVLKIDRSLIARALQEPRVAALVRAVVAMGDALGAQVVAEGVEFTEQRDWVVSVGCRLVQGYLLGPAMPRPELVAMVREPTGSAVPVPWDHGHQ